MVYCPKCGLWMSNGFCPHGMVVTAAQRVMLQAVEQMRKREQGQR